MESIERQVTLPVDLEGAWELLTRPEDLAAWLGAEVVLDPTPGAAGRVVDDDGAERRLVVDAAEPSRRLAWRWWSDDAPEEASRVEISLAPVEGGKAVRVVEELVGATPAARASARDAWSHLLLHLEALLLIAAAVRG